MPETERLRNAGEQAVQSLKSTLAVRLAELLRRDPDRLATAVETGIVSRDWLERPGEAPISDATPTEMVRRYLERSVDQRPSTLAALGLSAIQILSWDRDASDGAEVGDGRPAHLAVVFTDLEGFTAHTEATGDAAATALLTAHQRTVGGVVRSRGGTVVKRIGDGTLLTFPSVEAAVLAALELVAAPPEPLAVRAGVHVGDVIVLRDDIVGHVVNLAARVTESAHGGQVAVTTVVRDAAPDLAGVTWSRAKRHRFHGIDRPTLVCRVERA